MRLESCGRPTDQRNGILILQGGPGTGKTSILGDIKRRAALSGSLCLHVTGFRDEHEIPFSVVDQLGHVPGIPDGVRTALRELIEHGEPSPVALLHDLAAALASAAELTDVVIVVDDAQFADRASLACLLYLARRIRTHSIGMALAFPRTLYTADAGHLEFLALPEARLVEAAPLHMEEVRVLLERGLGERAAELAGPVHELSGGNPALVTALVRDLLHAGPVRPEAPVPIGEFFRTAYLASLIRHPALGQTVKSLALLGEDATPARVARLLEQPLEAVEHQLLELEHSGLLKDGAFRHPAVPAAVLSVLGERLPGLHRRAASLLFTEGAPATAVARHLIASDERPDPSQVRVLRHAWQQFLTAGQAEPALACLRLASRADIDERLRTKIVAALVSTLCCVNPSAAEPDAERLLAAARAGHADCRALRLLVVWSLWFGYRDRAREIMELLLRSCGPSHAHDETRGFAILIGSLWPELLDDPEVRAYFRGGRDSADALGLTDESTGGMGRHGTAAVDTRLFWGLDAVPLLELIGRGELRLADRLCEEHLSRVKGREFPARKALLMALHARVRWQLGDLRTAARYAEAALELLPDHGWGVTISTPLSVLISSHSLMGELDRAARYLERPVPEELGESACGPLYRIARGGYLLEIGRPYAALQDFLACAPAKGSDLLGWRACAAEAYLVLGDRQRARRTAIEELVRGGPSADVRGRALLVLAAIDGPDLRRAHLEEAERTLRTAGNRLSLARTLARLSQEDWADGRTQMAQDRWDEALGLAAESGAPHRLGEFAPPSAGGGAVEDEERAGVDALTDAEWRVASLAAEGRSNRQIATQLYITVSTVEQHLTRVYRKLPARRRSELSELLRLATREEERA